MKPIPKLLSKTKLLRGYRCLKCIYLTVHNPEYEAPITPETQALFDQGNEVGALARKYVPGGTLVDLPPWEFVAAMEKTKRLISEGVDIIYEAAFSYAGCYARADIIQKSSDTNRWKIIEVKSTTKVKPEHLDDVGLQTWIITKSGLPVEQINVMHLNTECRYPDLSNLFITQDVTDELRSRYLGIQPKVAEIFQTLGKKDIPDINIGPQCRDPNDCGFAQHCWKEKNIPEMSVLDLPGLRERKWQLYQSGVTNLDDPRLTDLNELQKRIVDAYLTGKRYVNPEGIQTALKEWRFPLIFLDFETINPAIPRYKGCGPFKHVPFQFSVHIWPSPEAELTHQAYLHEKPDDPRLVLIPQLLEACGKEGSIVAYFGRFESERIAELAQFDPSYQDVLQQLIDRIVDPLPILRENVYDNGFLGSFSLKHVAPAILGDQHSYDGMIVADGGAAQRAFEELISPNISPERKIKLKNAMLDYCNKDTLVMVELVKWLYTL